MLRGCLHGAVRQTWEIFLADTQIYMHPKRPEWGFAIFNDEIEDRVRFAFHDNQIRAFRADSLHVLHVVDLPEPEATKVRAELSRKRTVTASGLPKKKAKPRAPKEAAAPKAAAAPKEAAAPKAAAKARKSSKAAAAPVAADSEK